MYNFCLNKDFFISINNSGAVLNFVSGNSYKVHFLGLLSFFKILKKDSRNTISLGNLIEFENSKLEKIRNIFLEESKSISNFAKNYIHLAGVDVFLAHYHGSCCQQQFLDYSKNGIEKDNEAMDMFYSKEIQVPSILTSYNESNFLVATEDTCIGNSFTSIAKKIPEASVKKSLLLSDIIKILKYTVGTRKSYKDKYGRGKNFRFVPSGGNNHPTNVYVIKKGSNGVAECYYYNHLLNTLIKVAGNLNFDSIISAAQAMKSKIQFKPEICLLYSQTPKRTMFRYKDQRTYRVLQMDL